MDELNVRRRSCQKSSRLESDGMMISATGRGDCSAYGLAHVFRCPVRVPSASRKCFFAAGSIFAVALSLHKLTARGGATWFFIAAAAGTPSAVLKREHRMARHVEIARCGGWRDYAPRARFSQLGWSVRLHETRPRPADVRRAGIWLWESGAEGRCRFWGALRAGDGAGPRNIKEWRDYRWASANLLMSRPMDARTDRMLLPPARRSLPVR